MDEQQGQQPKTGVAIRAYVLLLLALVAEGYDLQAANFAAPELVRVLGITRAEVGPLLSASLVGVLLGAVLIGPLGDRLGRKRLIVWACVSYGVFSLIASQMHALSGLIALRFLIGVGLGGVLPNALALAGEVSPPGRQASATAIIGIGITFGGVVAGMVAAALLPAYGWPSLFIVGGVVPLLIAVLLQVGLPESPAFLNRGPTPRAVDATPTPPGPGVLLQGGMAWVTIGIWVVFAAVLMTVYLLSGWLPLLLGQSGFSPRAAALITSGYHAGGVIGGITASLLLGRHGWKTVAIFAFAACLFLVLLLWDSGSTALLALGIMAAGFCVTGTQNAINGAAGVTYPASMRARGLGWALGLGRLGSIAGPLVGSLAVWLGLTQARELFMLPLIPLGIAAGIALALRGRTAQ